MLNYLSIPEEVLFVCGFTGANDNIQSIGLVGKKPAAEPLPLP